MRNRVGNRKESFIDSGESSLLLNVSQKNSKSRLTLHEVLEGHLPDKEGTVLKKSNSIWAYIFPCIYKSHQPRYLVLVGSYLYRFTDNHPNSRLKGLPIPITVATVSQFDDTTIILRTIRKEYIFQMKPNDCLEWIDALRQRKYFAIKEEMNHKKLQDSIRNLNIKAERLIEDKIQNERRSIDVINADPALNKYD